MLRFGNAFGSQIAAADKAATAMRRPTPANHDRPDLEAAPAPGDSERPGYADSECPAFTDSDSGAAAAPAGGVQTPSTASKSNAQLRQNRNRPMRAVPQWGQYSIAIRDFPIGCARNLIVANRQQFASRTN